MCADQVAVLAEFRAECAKPSAKVEWDKRTISKNAQWLLGLNTREDLLNFIAGKRIEPLIFLESMPYRMPGPNQGVIVYGYSFKTTSRDMYMAFYKANTGFWIIKSLKEPELPLNRNVISLAMEKAEIMNNEIKQLKGDL